MKRSISHMTTVCIYRLFLVFVALSFIQLMPLGTAGAAETGRQVNYLSLSVGKSTVVNTNQSVTRVSIADPKIADFVLISPREMYVTGQATGMTNMTLWSKKKVIATYNISVTPDVEQLQANINIVLPGEQDVQVLSSADSITLFGKVSTAASLSRVLSLAEACAPDGKVHNLLEVGGGHQVMLEVRISEISRKVSRELGINMLYNSGSGGFGATTLDGIAQGILPGIGDSAVVQSSDRVNAFFRFGRGDSTWTGLIDALSEDGIIKVLAEPNLIALSGQSASFLAGGEFPVPVPQGLGTAAIEWKTYGVLLNFTPVVLGNGKIHLSVEPTVSEPDASLQIVLDGSFIPALKTRTVKTAVELNDGQSFAIAGLLSNNTRSFSAKYPFLGDIPILGMLFSSKKYQKNETELVVIVTPRIVKPFNQQETPLPLPTDSYKEPTELDFYLFGKIEGDIRSDEPLVTAELDGEFGHAVPSVETMELEDMQDLQ